MCPDLKVFIGNEGYLDSKLNEVMKSCKESMTLQQDCQKIENEKWKTMLQ